MAATVGRFWTRRRASHYVHPLPGHAPATGAWTAQRHALADLWECPAERLDDEDLIRSAMVEAAERAGATVIYSREFYDLVRRHLDAAGFVAIDTPSGWCEKPDNHWAIYYSTLRAAGFETVVPMVARINTRAAAVTDAVDRFAHHTELTIPVPGGTIALNETQARTYYGGAFDELLSQGTDEFALAFPSRRAVNAAWQAGLAVPLHVFGPAHLPLAFPDACPTDVEPAKVNSIARPTVPELELLSIRFP